MKQQPNASHPIGSNKAYNQNEVAPTASSSVKKSASSFFEKHAFASNSHGSGAATAGQVVTSGHHHPGSKIASSSTVASATTATGGVVASSTYNMHRQNATRTDPSAGLQLHQQQQQQLQHNSGSGSGNSRDKPQTVGGSSNISHINNINNTSTSNNSSTSTSKQQFSQNMLSKSQHFASIQFNQQAMLSQQSYLAQGGNPGGGNATTSLVSNVVGLGAQPINSGMASIGGSGSLGAGAVMNTPPIQQQQNFIGSGLLNSAAGSNVNNSLNSSASQQLNNSGNDVNCSQEAAAKQQLQQHYNSHGGTSQGIMSPNKRHVSKTSMSKRSKNAAQAVHQHHQHIIVHQNNHSVSPGQPLLEASGLPHHQQAKMIMTASQSSLAQKRYSANLSGVNAQMTANSGNSSSQHAGSTAAQQQHHIQLQQHHQQQQQQFSKHGTISKSESNNKLRRISNMKQNKEKSNSDRRNQGLILSNNQATSASGSVSQGLQVAQQYTQSSNPNLRFMHQQNGQPSSHNISATNALPSNLKSTSHSGASGGNGGAPANMSNLTSFQQSHSERTSLTDEAHNSAMLSMQWQMREGGVQNSHHAQCSTERYTAASDHHHHHQRGVRFMQQLQSSSANGASATPGTASGDHRDHHQRQQMIQQQNLYQGSATPGSVIQQNQYHSSNASSSNASSNNANAIMVNAANASNSQTAASLGAGKKKSNKATNEKLFFVTDHKLFEDQGNAPIVGGCAGRAGATNDLLNSSSNQQQKHQFGSNSTTNKDASPIAVSASVNAASQQQALLHNNNHQQIQQHHLTNQNQQQQQHLSSKQNLMMQYDIEMENIQVNAGGANVSLSQTQPKGSMIMYHHHHQGHLQQSNKGGKQLKQASSTVSNSAVSSATNNHNNVMLLSSSIIGGGDHAGNQNMLMNSSNNTSSTQQQHYHLHHQSHKGTPVDGLHHVPSSSTSNKTGLDSNTVSSSQQQSKQQHASIVCPIYQSKDYRLITGQQTSTASMLSSSKNSIPGSAASVSHQQHVLGGTSNGSKSDQKDVKRGSDGRKESNKGATTGQGTAARRSMSDDMHEDVYMAKSDHQKSRKTRGAFKTNSVIEHQNNNPNNTTSSQQATHHNSSINSSNDAYERQQYQQVKKSSSVFHQNAAVSQKVSNIAGANSNSSKAQQHQQWTTGQDERFGSSSQHYSETSSSKIHHNQSGSTKQERRDAEPLADKLLYLTNQACQSKVKSKSQLTNSMKSAQGYRKGIKSPGAGSQSTLQEPSAKAMPTSSKVKISQKFNKFEQSNPSYKGVGIPGHHHHHPTKQNNLFQTNNKTLKKQGSGPLNDFKELHKSPEVRHGHVKKNGSISYAILPRTVIPSTDLKAHKKIKSPSPSIKLSGPEAIQRMRSPQTVKQQMSYQQNATGGANTASSNNKGCNLGGADNSGTLANSASQQQHLHHHHQVHAIVKEPHTTKHANSSQQQLFEARRLSQQRASHKTPQLAQNHQQNKSHLIDSSSTSNNVNNKSAASHHAASMGSSIAQSKRISFSDMQQASNKVLVGGNEGGADEAKKLYCMVDSRKNSQTSLHNVPSLGQTLGQVQILQVDSQGNNKSKVQLKTKDKLQNYMKPPGFLSQSPKAKKHSAASKQSSAVHAQSSMLMTHGSTNNISQSKLATSVGGGVGTSSSHQQKFVHQMQAAYSTANSSLQREIMKNSQSGAIGSMAQKALLQIQAPKVVHLQSPPSRILVKASPRVSPNPKIRKQGIQTCKVSIDALQKTNAATSSGQQKVNRANSKEFLKTIKLMKRGSNSPSPSSANQMMNQGNTSPSSSKLHHASSHHNHQIHQVQSSQQSKNAAKNINHQQQQMLQHDSLSGSAQHQQQLKNYNSQNSSSNHHHNKGAIAGERQSSQNSNSTLIRPTSQNNKLFSRLQLRRAKEAQLSSAHNNNEMVSFSERQTHDVKAAESTASLLMAPLSSQSNPAALAQQLVDQYSSSQPEMNQSQSQQDHHYGGPSSKQSSSAGQKTMQKRRMSKDQQQQNSATHGQEKAAGVAIGATAHRKSSKERATNPGGSMAMNQNQHSSNNNGAGSNKLEDNIYDEKGQVTIERPSNNVAGATKQQAAGMAPNAAPSESSDLASKKQKQQSKNNPSTAASIVQVGVVHQTPSKKVNSKQVAPVSATQEKEENLIPRQNANKFNTPKTEENGSGLKQQSADQQHNYAQAQAHKDSKACRLTSQSNEEMREQAAFQKDIEKLKRLIRLHFQNYNQAPETSCEFYRIGRVLGKGAFGKVSLAMHKIAEQLVAIKSMSRETLRDEADQRRRTKLEMGILKQCNHPNVVRLFDTFETNKHICFVIELCSGGDLFSYIKKRRRLKEDVARFFFKQLVEGLAYIHNAKKVVHRDIKLENILLDATGNVKICDFGVSRQLKTGRETLKEQCGTPAYIAPEILLDEGYQGFKVDMWSAGVCLYAMLIGSVPFKASTMSKLQDLIIRGEYDFKFQTNANSKQMNNPKAATTLLSEDVQDLIKQLLQTNPDKRLSAVETLNHPWLQQGDPNLDVYTEKEKQLIQRDYMRLNLKLGQHHGNNNRVQSAYKSTASKVGLMTPTSQMHLESEQILFTEHNLETRMGEEEPNLQNQEEKSFILAPFNSVKSMFIDQGNQIKEVKKDDPPFIWPKEVTDLIAPRRVIKFSTKCREKNRIYEQNNNADLDNGVYNEFVNEQEREEGALMNGQQDDGKDDMDPSSSIQNGGDSFSDGEDDEDISPGRHVVSQNSMFKQEGQISSEDSLEKSFKETEQLASDDEEATMQIAESKKLQNNRDKQPNQEALNLLQNSVEHDQEDDEEDDDDVGDDDDYEESPAREQVITPKRLSPLGQQQQHAPVKKTASNPTSQAQQKQPTQPSKTPAAAATAGGSLTKQKSRTQLRSQQVVQIPAKASIVVHEYVEPEFVIDEEVVQRIQNEGVIPRWYLLEELTLLANDQDRLANDQIRLAAARIKQQRLNNIKVMMNDNERLAAARDKFQGLNYITASYFLLVKRKELEELQRRQEAASNSKDTNSSNNNNRDSNNRQQQSVVAVRTPPRKEEQKKAID